MGSCFWGLCDCPTSQPCTHHHGFQCGTWRGQQVSKLTDINDPTTRDGDISVLALAADKMKANQKEEEISRQLDDLKQQQAIIDRGMAPNSTFGQRRAAAAELSKFRDDYGNLQAKILQAQADIASLNARIANAGALVFLNLTVPFTDGNSTCDCYTKKLDHLNALDSRMTYYQGLYNSYALQLAPIQAQATAFVNMMPSRNNIFSMMFTFLFLAGIIGFLIGGPKVAALTVIVFGLLVIILLLSMIRDILRIKGAMASVRRQKLISGLEYYRLQQVLTCQLAPIVIEQPEEIPG
jgi:hypothetical protein